MPFFAHPKLIVSRVEVACYPQLLKDFLEEELGSTPEKTEHRHHNLIRPF
jgi:hypothetical protein